PTGSAGDAGRRSAVEQSVKSRSQMTPSMRRCARAITPGTQWALDQRSWRPSINEADQPPAFITTGDRMGGSDQKQRPVISRGNHESGLVRQPEVAHDA